MVNFHGSTQFSIPSNVLQLANKAVVVDKKTMKEYDKSHVNVLKGNQVETLIFQLVSLLDVKHVYLSAKGSQLDCRYKVDIVITRKDGSVVPMQIKASKQGAEDYLSKYPTIVGADGKTYPAPSVIYMEQGDKSIEVLFALQNFLCVDFKPMLKEAVGKLKSIKGKGTAKKTMLLSELGLGAEQVEALKLLELATVKTNIARTTVTF